MKKNIYAFLISIITSFSVLIELDKVKIIKTYGRSTISLTFCILTILLFILYKNYKPKKDYIGFKVLALIFAILMTLGYSFDKLNSLYFVFGNIKFFLISLIKILGYYYLFNIAINKLYTFINDLKLKDFKHPLVKKFYEKPILYSFIIILLGWSIYIISFYPVILSPDPTNQIKSYFNIPTRYIDGIKLVDEFRLLTNDNPIFHTFILGGSVGVGKLLNNDNLGLFIYSFIQITTLLSCLLYSINYMIKIKAKNIFIFGALAIYTLVPLFPLYAMSAVKDVLFSAVMLIFIIKIFDKIRYGNWTNKDYIFLTIISILVTLTRNNGIYHVLFTLPFILIFSKGKEKNKLTISILSILLFYLSFINILLPNIGVTGGNKREMLSVPFQQTARYVKYHENELTKEEIKIIDKILTIETLKDRYDPIKADKVKNGFNALSTDEDLKEYFKVWFNMLLKKPGLYVEATMNNIYGFFYPNTTKWYVYYDEYKDRLNETDMFDYHYNNLNLPRNILSGYADLFPHIPVIGMFANIGFMVWVYLFMLVVLIKENNKKYIIVLLPALTLIAICVLGPVNTYFRYTLPYVFAFPVTLAMLYSIRKKDF